MSFQERFYFIECINQKQKDTKEETATDTIDYKAVYDSIFKPFKANGKTIAPRNAEDVISLMQMGENNYWYGALRPTTGTSDFDIWIDTENVPTYMVNKDTMQVYLTTSEPTDANVNDLWLDGE